jgi:SAM-dependent methyltransferase
MKDELEKQARFFHLGERYFWLGAQNTLVERRLRPHVDRLAAEVRPRRPRILDIGCGPGNTIRRFLRAGDVYGFDYSLDSLAFARTKGIKNVFSGDSVALPIASGAFDCVIALDVLEHVEDDARLLREIVRVLRPGGLFFITVPAFMALWRYHDEAYGHFRRYRRGELDRRVREAGLEVAVCQFFKCAFFPPLWVLAVLERRGLIPRRDSFFAVPDWLNGLMTAEIVWEDRLNVGRVLPFGVSLFCFGRRAG